jgi:hypothetical protein
MHLYNGDKCIIGQEIHPNPTFIARVVEVIQQIGSPAQIKGQPDGVLLQTIISSTPNNKYQMPQLSLKNEWSFVKPQVKFLSTLCFYYGTLESC